MTGLSGNVLFSKEPKQMSMSPSLLMEPTVSQSASCCSLKSDKFHIMAVKADAEKICFGQWSCPNQVLIIVNRRARQLHVVK